MANTVPSRTVSTPLNTLVPRQAKASIGINRSHSSASDEASDFSVSLVFETLAEIGMSDKEAAYTMAMDPAQLSRVKTGQARLPIDALWRLPDRFWLAFNRRVDSAKGINPVNEVRLRAARIGELVRLLVEGVA